MSVLRNSARMQPGADTVSTRKIAAVRKYMLMIALRLSG